MKQEGVNGLPADLAGYESLVRQTLTDNQKKGGVAMKFEAAYFRYPLLPRSPARKSRSDLRQISRRRRSFGRGVPHLSGLRLPRV